MMNEDESNKKPLSEMNKAEVDKEFNSVKEDIEKLAKASVVKVARFNYKKLFKILGILFALWLTWAVVVIVLSLLGVFK